MTSYFDPNAVRSWIGLKTYDGFEVVDIIAAGSINVIFKAVRNDLEIVMRIPRSHIGFVIDLPPNGIFRLDGLTTFSQNDQEQSITPKDLDYDKKLNARLLTLVGSSWLFNISPLDIVWDNVALDLFHSAGALQISYKNEDVVENQESNSHAFSRLAKYSSFILSNFILERLSAFVSVCLSNNPQEMIVDNTGVEQSHTAFSEVFAYDAKTITENLNAIFVEVGAREPIVAVENNPFLPFIAAIGSGYHLSDVCASSVAQLLEKQREMNETLRQLCQIVQILMRGMSHEEKSRLTAFIMATTATTSKIRPEELLLCMDELK